MTRAKIDMEKSTNTIQDILSLARYEGKPDQVSIFCRIFGLLLDNKVDPGTLVYSLLFQMMDVLWFEIGIPMRIELAKRVAKAPNAPAGLTMRFAVDEPEVASHILKDDRLDDRFLIQVISKTRRAHHLLIAERVDLSEAVWKAITSRRQEKGRPTAILDPSPTVAIDDQNIFSLELGKNRPVRVRITNREVTPATKPVPLVDALVAAAMEDAKSSQEERRQESEKRPNAPLKWNWKTDRSGALIEIDAACCKAFGMGPDQLIGQNLFALVRDAHHSDVQLVASIDKRTPIRNLPVEIKDNFGSLTNWVLSGKAFFEIHGGKFEGYEGSASQNPEDVRGLADRP